MHNTLETAGYWTFVFIAFTNLKIIRLGGMSALLLESWKCLLRLTQDYDYTSHDRRTLDRNSRALLT